MGIPYLTRHLASFSEPIVLGNSPDLPCEAVKSVVIDGPGLVHHVHAILLAQASADINQIERQPSCDEVSVAVMGYLVLLQSSGVNISKIYFDGALPLHKRETRLSRLEFYRKQLETFCLNHRQGFKKSPIERPPAAVQIRRLLKTYSPPTKRAQLPGNAFMVFAVTEDLKSRWTSTEIRSCLPEYLAKIYQDNTDHPWSDITEIVPGEADVFCAAFAAQRTNTAILTSDSDLFLFDLGPDSCVVFFDSIHAERCDNDVPTQSTIIRAMRFCSVSIADRLGIPALSYLAHEMNMSPRSKFPELVRRAKDAAGSSQRTPAYLSFLEEYDLINFQYSPSDAYILQRLDTRVSELFAQCIWSSKFEDQTPRIYLPFLLEDHSRRCAWAEGTSLRSLAYSLLNLNNNIKTQFTSINECVRRGRRFCFDDLVLLNNEEEIKTEATRLLDGLELIQQGFRGSMDKNDRYSPLYWRTFALYVIHPDWFTTASHNSVPYKGHLALRTFLGLERKNGGDGNIEWDDVHALAQLQSVLYSVRIVSQIIRDITVSDGSIKKLQDVVGKLPPLHILMRSYHEVRRELHDVANLPEYV